jgi:hypothetical protein
MAELANISALPVPSKERGQRSIPISEAYFARIIPSWSQPSALMPEQWRAWVKAQPIAVTCKETMTSNILDLDWKITPRESDQMDELKATIRHYEKLLQRGGESGLDWAGLVEWTLEDALDLPFGSAWEVGRKDDSENGRVMWLEPIDGGTCYPTNNKDYPVLQYYNAYQALFPKHAIARMYFNPRTEIERKGWGTAPPERIFLALEMLMRGDRYYANLLLDIPPAGVFDLGDITWDDAHTWIQSFRSAVTGGGSTDAFRIPVLAEHTGKVEFIPLGKAPNDIMYDRITLKYASLVCAGYGMNLGDIGVASASSSGETLAGSIRGEQKTNRTGKARVKRKFKHFIESFLPPTLQFAFIDTDGERLSMLGRARLANATALNQLRDAEALSPAEIRLQFVQDGLLDPSFPEKPPADAKKPEPVLGQAFGKPGKKAPERPGQVGSPQPPSLGGDGEVKKSLTFLPSSVNEAVEKVVSVMASSIRSSLEEVGEDDYAPMKSVILNTVFSEQDELGMGAALESLMNSAKIGEFKLDELELEELGFSQSHVKTLKERCERSFPVFLGKAIVYTLVNSEYLFSGDVVERVQERVNKSLSEYAASLIGIEAARLLEEITANPELPETVRLRSLQKSPPANIITVEGSQITMPPVNVAMPDVKVDGTTVNVEGSKTEVNLPEQTNQFTFNVPERESVVNLTVPERQTNLTVEGSKIDLSVPQQPAPVTNVYNQVQPTPVENKVDVTVQPAEVNIPKPVREIQQVHRDINQNISATETEIRYDE